MKPKSTFRSFLLLAGSALLAAPLAHAFTLTWDATAGGAINDGAGAWLGAGQWNDTGTPSITWTSGDDAIFGVGGTGGAVTLASPTTVNSLTFNTFTGTYTLGTAGQAITLNNGITMIASSGAATFVSPITLGGAQNWTNNSPNNASSTTGSLNINNTLNLNGNALTIGGSGLTSFGSAAAAVISGAGGINVTGGRLWLGAGQAPIHTYSGDTSITGGAVVMISGNASANSNININGGVLESYWTNGLTRNLGTGATEVRITGGESGFGMNGSNGATFNLGASAISWGSTNFNPTKLILQTQFSQGVSALVFSTPINLNSVSADRTIVANAGVSGTASSTISGAITNSAGTGGLIKEGAGNLILSNTANTYNGNTTINAGTLSAAATGSLGSASNTLIFDGSGTTLRATGAITSPSTRAVTLTSAGIIDTNGQAVSFAGNITGAGGLTKNGTNTLTLSGTNNYPGTIVNAGTLAIKSEASLNTGAAASWTAANINVKSGATLALNVDSAGAAGFDVADLNTLLGNIYVANSAAEGLQGGVTLGIDTSTATGATFTMASAITNSTGAFGGVINLNKLGAGTLVLNQANTYTGNTIISGGTIQYDTGAAIPTTPITNNAAFAFNTAGALTQGTNFGLISGTGTVTQSGAGTLTLNLANTYTGTTTATAGTIILSNALAIQNSALNTTGAGFVTLSGVTTPTFGGLSNSGTTRDLATVISTGYGSVTNLTLNPAGSVTYDGVIGDGAAGMSLTKTGAGTQILTGIQTYTGATILNLGTLTLSGTGSILPSAITLNGGGLTLTNTAAETGSGRVHDSTVITSNGGTLTYTNTSGANTYAETIGNLNLVKGQANLVLSTDQVGAGSQTLTLAGLTRTGATNASAITFSAAGTGLNATKNMILVTGASATPAGDIIAPWATIGTAANVQTAFAAYDASGYVVAAVPTGAPADTDLASSSGNYDINTGSLYTLTGTRTVNAVQFRGALSTLDLSTFKLETNGLFFNGGAGNAKTVTAGAGGALTTPTGGGYLYITAGQVMTAGNEHKISAPITDNSGTVHLVKSGSGTLILNGTNYTYTGDTVVNAGTLQFGVGTSGGTLTQINGGTYAGNIFIARGAALSLQGSASNNLSGIISGDGNLNLNRGTTTLSGANTYTGKTSMSLVATNSVGSTLNVSSFNSVNGGTPLLASSSLGAPTTVANGTIEFGGTVQVSAQINYTGSGETTDRVINFNFNGNGSNRTIDASGGGLLKFTSPFTSNGTASNNVVLQGTSSGEIVAGLPFAFINFTKSGAGSWTLGGILRNTGATTVNGGTLVLAGPVSTAGLTTVTGASSILTLSGDNISMAGGVTVTNSRLNIGHANALGTGTLSIGGAAPSIDNTSGSALTVATNNAQAWNGDFTFAGTNSLNLGTGAVALGGNRNITVTGNTLTVGGVISGAARGVQKSGGGTLVLTGANTYSGNTTVSGGTLALGANDVLPSTPVTIANGTLNAATFDDTAGTLAVTNAASTINLGAGANLAFADSSGVAWTGGTLNITGTFVSGSSLKFGDNDAGLSDAQLLQITAAGFSSFDLDPTGYLTAVPDGGGSAYDAWKAANAPGSNPDDDTDGDGVSNAVEFVLGGTSLTNDIGKLPTVSTSGGNLLFTFLRKQSSVGPGSTTSIEVGTNLVTWPSPSPYAVPDADTGGVVNPGVTVVAGVPAGFDTVTLRVAQAPDTKKFARLKVVITP